jgi:hypothetical protein
MTNSFGFADDLPEGAFYCRTCDGSGGLTIAGVCYLEVTCPTCHGESRGMSLEAYWKQLEEDAEFDARYNGDWLDELRKRKP